MFQRDDDTEVVVRKRLKVYTEETDPVVDWYRKTTNIVEIDGSQEIRDVEASLNEALR